MSPTTTSLQSHYQVLGLPPSATIEEVKKAYKKLSLKYHPDKTPDKNHHELFIKINQAYEVLKEQKENNIKTASAPDSFNNFQFTTSSARTSNDSGGYSYYRYYNNVNNFQKRAAEEAAAQAERLRREMLERARAEEELRKREFQKKQEEYDRRKKQEEYERKKRQEELEMRRRKQEAEERQRQRDQRVQEFMDQLAEENKEKLRQQRRPTDEQYYFAKKQAMYQQTQEEGTGYKMEDHLDSQYRNGTQTSGESSFGTGDSSDPIVVEDEISSEVESEEEQDSEEDIHESFDVSGSNQPPEYVSLSDEASSYSTPVGNEDRQEQEEEEEDDDDKSQYTVNKLYEYLDAELNIPPKPKPKYFYKSASPKRSKPQSQPPSSPIPKAKFKRFKPAFDMEDLEKNLGNNIETLDFSDLLDSLPHDKSQKRSPNLNAAKKRPAAAEYSDGTSKAETLHTPLNKQQIHGHIPTSSKLSMLDLNASPAVHSFSPPNPPNPVLDPHISLSGWKQYVNSIKKYQEQFLNYKRLIVQYQIERTNRDVENFELINTNGNMEIYTRCLQRDLDVNKEFTEALRVFSNTMNVYKQNCDWMKMINSENFARA
ncbi:DnaJ subfamily A member 4 [Spathaspora sp. JA1]|nr:DnaJ subfamily A member 4 [Spathaspora sp. JA1]